MAIEEPTSPPYMSCNPAERSRSSVVSRLPSGTYVIGCVLGRGRLFGV